MGDDDSIVFEMKNGTVLVYSCQQILGLNPLESLTDADEDLNI